MSPFNPDPQNRYPSPRSDSGQSRDDERVIEAEIIHDGCDDGRDQGPYGRSCRGGYGQEQFRGSRSPWNGGLHFQTIWTSGSSRQAGLAPGITLALIIIAGIQFGLLASIGFGLPCHRLCPQLHARDALHAGGQFPQPVARPHPQLDHQLFAGRLALRWLPVMPHGMSICCAAPMTPCTAA